MPRGVHEFRKHHKEAPVSHRFTVITGGPGSGKSTLIEALRSQGFHALAEAGRGIIQD
ncbi:MAG: AAA family ATPase, partial [Sciscionella sp.]